MSRSMPGTVALAMALRSVAVRARNVPRPLGLPLQLVASAIYRGYALGVVGMDVPTRTTIGPGLTVHHGIGLVVHADTVIGRNVLLRQNTTIGAKGDGAQGAPVLEDGVDVGANVSIIGPVRIGAGAIIGTGSVVVKDVPAGATVVGKPRPDPPAAHIVTPSVSVLMPVRNGQATIRRALRSTLAQLPEDAEVLVHDDASTDGTLRVIAAIGDARVKVESVSSSLGVAGALNALIDRASGTWLARMDADDVTLPGRFRASLQAASAGADLVFTNRVNFGNRPQHWRPAPLSPLDAPLMRLVLALDNPVAHSTLLARGDLLRGEHRYRPGPAEDYDLWMRLVADGASAVRLRRPGIGYRIHSQQVTRRESYLRRFIDDAVLRSAHDSYDRALGWDGEETWVALFDEGVAGETTSLRAEYGAFLRGLTSSLPSADRRRLEGALRRARLG